MTTIDDNATSHNQSISIPIVRLSAVVGQYSLVNPDADEDVVAIRAVVINPNFDSASRKNDLALLQVLYVSWAYIFNSNCCGC